MKLTTTTLKCVCESPDPKQFKIEWTKTSQFVVIQTCFFGTPQRRTYDVIGIACYDVSHTPITKRTQTPVCKSGKSTWWFSIALKAQYTSRGRTHWQQRGVQPLAYCVIADGSSAPAKSPNPLDNLTAINNKQTKKMVKLNVQFCRYRREQSAKNERDILKAIVITKDWQKQSISLFCCNVFYDV